MPLYEYRCRHCDRTFEELRRLSEADLPAECPQCEGTETERLLSAFATSAGTTGSGASSCGGGSRGFT